MFTLDNLFLLPTGILAAYLCWHFFKQYQQSKALHNLYYLIGFAVLLVSGLLLIFLGMQILSSPYVLTVASLIPLGISMGLAEEYFPSWKRAYKWFAVIGFLTIAVSSIGGWKRLKRSLSRYSTGWQGSLSSWDHSSQKAPPKGFGGLA